MEPEIARWIDARARPLTGWDPGLPLDDLEPLRRVVGDAVVVGLGESIRFAREVTGMRVRVLRFLVERLGFGVLALEDVPDVGERLDAWVHGSGAGGPEAILDDAWPVYRTEEFVALLHRLRGGLGTHDVRVAGVIPPGVPPSRYDPAATAERIAALPGATGRRVVFWAGSGHTAVHHPAPGFPPYVFDRTEGTHLRERFGDGYASVGVTFDHGDAHWPIAPASPELAEHALAGADGPRLLDLTGPVPDAVAAWLDTPTRARVIGPSYDPDQDAGFSIAGTPLRTLFDALVHVPEVTSVTPSA